MWGTILKERRKNKASVHICGLTSTHDRQKYKEAEMTKKVIERLIAEWRETLPKYEKYKDIVENK